MVIVYTYSGGDMYMIRNKENIKNVDGVLTMHSAAPKPQRGWAAFPLYGHEEFLAGGSAIFVLGEWVVKIDLLANRSTHWPVG